MDNVVTYSGNLSHLTNEERVQMAKSLLRAFIGYRPSLAKEILKDSVTDEEINYFMEDK